MKKLFLAITLFSVASFPAFAGMQHDHSSHSMQAPKGEEMKHEMETLEAKIDGYEVSFDIMTHKDYHVMMKMMKMGFMQPTAGTTHHIAVSIYKEKNRIGDAAVNMKVISPDGKEEVHMLNYNPDMMNQYVGHFNMPRKGKYQFLLLFKDGIGKHSGGVYYEMK